MAMKSWMSSRLTTISPTCRWCSTVVGSSLMPRMVLENVTATPVTTASRNSKPNASMTEKPIAKKAMLESSAVNSDFMTMLCSFDGCRSRPTRKSRKMIPISAISERCTASVTRARPCGPSRQPMAMYATSSG